ncbi:polymer-forming cytoskeletal protein [Nitrosomonas sp. Nm166]|uniref:bactofilin family protein n=1 Tax=Nitrosomonas sp. Nm166 TaxID=1881054 RepID=UPI0008F29246|nr:polymer-forming cytoskeletal protein [Nitrosomonas sp. Nm166]SFE46239.1 protein CcmA, bactofilin family [Nitrosomonas sp. Nm166]
MFGRKKKKQFPNHFDTLIGINTSIIGDINFRGGLRVDGHIIGNVIAADDEYSTLVLSDEGSIAGQIKVTHIIINGTVTGPIYAQEYLELQAKAKVYGDIHYGSLEIQLGASAEGKMVHQNQLESENKHQSEKIVTFIPSTPDEHITTESDSYNYPGSLESNNN